MGTVMLAASISFAALQHSIVPYGGGLGGDVQAAGVRVERHGLDVTGELGRGRGKDGVELGEDAAAGGRCGHAALGHHHRDCAAESERLAAVPAYDRAGAPLRLLLACAAVLLRRLLHRDQGLAREVDPAQLAAYAITAPAVSPSSGLAASSASRADHGAGAACSVRTVVCSRNCSSRIPDARAAVSGVSPRVRGGIWVDGGPCLRGESVDVFVCIWPISAGAENVSGRNQGVRPVGMYLRTRIRPTP
ncbi:hypothetical protein [Streptomyces sp. NPDC002676]